MNQTGNDKPNILICDDDSLFQLALKHALKDRYNIKSSYNCEEAVAILKKQKFDIVLLDISMRDPREGLNYLPQLKDLDPDMAVIMISGSTDFSTVRESMRLGATDYIPKDFNPEDLAHTIELALEKNALLRRKGQQNFEAKTHQNKHVLVGKSKSIQDLHALIERFRKSPANILITGETGTGKEVVARLLRGTHPDGGLCPFISIDSSTIQSSTAESLLFGHEKGAFTGADQPRKGVFEEAHQGIVYFDEIANMPLDIQAKLLRVLQEREIVRMGSSKSIQLDFRVISASNKNLDAFCSQGNFKHDLLQRLNVLPIELSPLRDRKEDIPLLLEHFSKIHASTRAPLRFSEEVIEVFSQYEWPGNIRELGNVVSYLSVMVEDEMVELSDLPPKFRDYARPTKIVENTSQGEHGFYQQVATYEKLLLTHAYEKEKDNLSRLALNLGMDRSHLYRKLKEFGIHPK